MTCLYEQFWACRSKNSSVSNCSVFLITVSAVFSLGNEMHHFRLSSSKICRASCLVKLFFLVSRHTFLKMKKSKTIIRTRPAWTMPAVGGCGHHRYTALTQSILLWFYAFSHLSMEQRCQIFVHGWPKNSQMESYKELPKFRLCPWNNLCTCCRKSCRGVHFPKKHRNYFSFTKKIWQLSSPCLVSTS